MVEKVDSLELAIYIDIKQILDNLKIVCSSFIIILLLSAD
jgi:hypothetical protein